MSLLHVADVDECRTPRICVNGRCKNTIGGYQCICPQGFELATNGRECVGKYSLICMIYYVKMFTLDFCYLSHIQNMY